MSKNFGAIDELTKQDRKKAPEKKEPKKKYSAKKEIKTAAIALLMKPSMKEFFEFMAWNENKSLNSFMGEILESYMKRNYKKNEEEFKKYLEKYKR